MIKENHTVERLGEFKVTIADEEKEGLISEADGICHSPANVTSDMEEAMIDENAEERGKYL